MLKKITCFLLAVLIMLSCFFSSFSAYAADDTKEKLVSLVKQFPNGKYWNHMGSETNNPDKVTDTPCESHSGCSWKEDVCSCNSFDKAIQCMGYAFKIAYEITGVSARDFTKRTTLKASSLRVGDVIRFRNDGHSICVTGVNGDQISFTDCNWDRKCGIRWGQMSISSIKNFSYVLHLSGNNRKNTDLDFYEGIEPDDSPVQQKSKETWKMGAGTLNIRKNASTSSDVIGSIPESARFYVYEKKASDDYLWGKVEYGSYKGWAALNYSEYLSGDYEKPEIRDAKAEYDCLEIGFNWDKVSGAEKYQLRIYDSNKKCILKFYTDDDNYSVTVPENGVYYAKVYAVNSLCPSWLIDGKLIEFKVEEKKEEEFPAVTGVRQIVGKSTAASIVLSWDEHTMADGYDVFRYNAELKKYESLGSTDVNSFTDKAVSAGKDYYYLVRAFRNTENGKEKTANIKVKCSTAPARPVKLRQSASTSGTATLKWNKVSNADLYVVYKYNSKTKTYSRVKATGNNYLKISQTAGSSAYYRVYATTKTDWGYVYGSRSEAFKLTSGPKKVSAKVSVAGTGKVKISWEKVNKATHYEIYRYGSDGYEKISTVLSKYGSFTNINLKSGKTYYYRVRPVIIKDNFTAYGSYSDKLTIRAK